MKQVSGASARVLARSSMISENDGACTDAKEIGSTLCPQGGRYRTVTRLASAVRDIHAALEPQKDRMAAAHFERLYEESPIVSALRDDVRTSCMTAAGVQSPLYTTVLQLAA
jgi:hypothetical protein